MAAVTKAAIETAVDSSPVSRFQTTDGSAILCLAGPLVLVVGILLRVIAAFHTGALVDEMTYQYLGAYTWKHGFPDIRPEFLQVAKPFLYHPPFFFFVLGGWFSLWGNDGLTTARMLSVLVSAVLMALVYLMARDIFGQRVATTALIFIAFDPWLILINQAVYIENTQMLFVVVAVWMYWRATRAGADAGSNRIGAFVLAGVALGLAVIYKQIGAYLLIAVAINYVLTGRLYGRGHGWMIGIATALVAVYALSMQLAFGSTFDNETIDQIRRTFYLRHAAGLNYGPLTAVRAILETYWVFPITIVALVIGGVTAIVLTVRIWRGKSSADSVIVSWSMAAVVFACAIALKSPHYFILWLIPLYILLASQTLPALAWLSARTAGSRRAPIGDEFQREWTPSRPKAEGAERERRITASRFLAVGLAVIVVINLWSFHARFMSGSKDALEQAISYVNTVVPPNAIVAVVGSAGPELTRPYVQFPANTRSQLFRRTRSRNRMSYLFIYWSLTNPIPTTLGHLNYYCRDGVTFRGFNDNAEVCRLVPDRLTRLASFSADDDYQKMHHP